MLVREEDVRDRHCGCSRCGGYQGVTSVLGAVAVGKAMGALWFAHIWVLGLWHVIIAQRCGDQERCRDGDGGGDNGGEKGLASGRGTGMCMGIGRGVCTGFTAALHRGTGTTIPPGRTSFSCGNQRSGRRGKSALQMAKDKPRNHVPQQDSDIRKPDTFAFRC